MSAPLLRRLARPAVLLAALLASLPSLAAVAAASVGYVAFVIVVEVLRRYWRSEPVESGVRPMRSRAAKCESVMTSCRFAQLKKPYVNVTARSYGSASAGADVTLVLVFLGCRWLTRSRFGLIQRHAGIGGIEHDQGLAGLDEVRVVGLDGDDGAAQLRRHLHDVRLHVGVVGVF